MKNSRLISLHINPQKFNLYKTGFTLLATPSEIVDALLQLTPAQLSTILRNLQKHTSLLLNTSPTNKNNRH